MPVIGIHDLLHRHPLNKERHPTVCPNIDVGCRGAPLSDTPPASTHPAVCSHVVGL